MARHPRSAAAAHATHSIAGWARPVVAVMLPAALALASLAVRPVASRQPVAGGPQWPQPPDAARIRFVTSISEPRDIGAGPGVFGRVWAVIAGRSRQPRVLRPK